METVGYLVMASIILIVFLGFLFMCIKVRMNDKPDLVVKISVPKMAVGDVKGKELEKDDVEKQDDGGDTLHTNSNQSF